jgi:probable HAF family extracellular repeat protein
MDVGTKRRRLTAAAIGIVAIVAAGCATDLGTLPGGTYSVATRLNEHGDIVGTSATLPGGPYAQPTHAFVQFAGGALTRIDGSSYASAATSINESGVVVGWVIATSGAPRRAFRWTQAGGMTDLGTLGGTYAEATDINDDGWVIGLSTFTGTGAFGDLNTHGFIRNPTTGAMTALPTDTTYPMAFPSRINNTGTIAGTVYSPIEFPIGSQAVIWTAGTHARTSLTPGSFSSALDINASGDIAGTAFVNAGVRAVRWSGPTHTMTPLGTLDGSTSAGYGISDDGAVVGISARPGGMTNAPFIWTAATGMQRLGTLGGDDASAASVNGAGISVGWSKTEAGDTHAARFER